MEYHEYNDLMKKIRCTGEFRDKMREILRTEPCKIEPVVNETYEDFVSGTDIAPKRSWTHYAAMAAAFVLVCGAVSGAVYGFKQLGEKKPSQEAVLNSTTTEYGTDTGTEDVTDVEITSEAVAAETTIQVTTAAPPPPDASVNDNLSYLFSSVNEYSRCTLKTGPTMVPQGKLLYDTTLLDYNITDLEGFKNCILSQEWEKAGDDTPGSDLELFMPDNASAGKGTIYLGDLTIGGDYISVSGQTYKLKNPGNISEAISQYLNFTPATELGYKINHSFSVQEGKPSNIYADYSYSSSSGDNVAGQITYDANKHFMCMSGYGTLNGKDGGVDLIMVPNDSTDEWDKVNGDPTAMEIMDTEGVVTDDLVYSYSNGILSYQPEFHYIYFLKDIERELAAESHSMYKDIDFASNNEPNGSIKYTFKRVFYELNGEQLTESGSCEYIIYTDTSNHLLSYEKIVGGNTEISYSLQNYTFDAPDFPMDTEYYTKTYNEIKQKSEALNK